MFAALCLQAIPARAQSDAILNDLAAYRALAEEPAGFAAAINLAHGVLEKAAQELGPDHAFLADVNLDIARYEAESGQNAVSASRYREAIRILSVNKGPDDWKIGEVYFSLGEMQENAGDNTAAAESYELASATYAGAKAWAEFREGNYAAAVDGLRAALEPRRRILGEVHVDVAFTLSNIGYVYRLDNDLQNAESFFREALAIQESVLPPSHLDTAWTMNELGVLLIQQEHYDEALELFERATAIWEGTLGENSDSVAQGLFNQAYLQEMAGRVPPAIALYERALPIRVRLRGEIHASVDEIAFALARLYADQERFEDADAMFARSGTIRASLYGEDSAEVATLFAEWAGVKQALFDLIERERLLTRSYEIRKAVLPPDHADLAHSMDALAGIYYETFRYEESVALFEQSLTIWEAISGPESETLAAHFRILEDLYRLLDRPSDRAAIIERLLPLEDRRLGADNPALEPLLAALGMHYFGQKRRGDAETLLNRALPIQIRHYGSDSKEVEETTWHLAVLASDFGQLDTALDHYETVLALRRERLGPAHPRVGMAMNNVAMLLLRMGRLAQAEPLFFAANEIIETADVPVEVKVTTLNNIAGFYDTLGRYDEAETMLQRALSLGEAALGPDHPDVALNLQNLGALYIAKGDSGAGVALLERAIGILERSYGPDHLEIYSPLYNLASIQFEDGNPVEARANAERAQAILQSALGPDHPEQAAVLTLLSRLEAQEGRYDSSVRMTERALELVQAAYGPDHPEVAVMLSNLAIKYNDAGRVSEAGELYDRALALTERRYGPDHLQTAGILENMSVFFRENDDLESALAASRRNIAIRDRLRALSDTGPASKDDPNADGYRYRWHLDLLLAAAEASLVAEDSLMREGFRVAQTIRTDAAARAMHRAALRFAAGDNDLSHLVRRHQDLSKRWQAINTTLVQSLAEADPARSERLRAVLKETERDLSETDRKLVQGFPDFVTLARPAPVTASDMRPFLGDGEAVLVYAFTRNRGGVWVLTPDRGAFVALDINAGELGTEAIRLREALLPMQPGRLRSFPAGAAHSLYRKLIEPALPLLDGVRSLYVVPDLDLQGIPLDLLLTEPPARPRLSGAQDLADAAWLIRDYAITILPGVSSLRALRSGSDRTDPARKPFLGFGDPSLDGGAGAHRSVETTLLFRGADDLADVDALRGLTRLPETATELRSLARTLGTDESAVYLEDSAREAALKSLDLSDTEVLAFATHGLVAGDFSAAGEPGLVLTPPEIATPLDDGILTAGEVAQLDLNADWVVLSACNTAAPDGTPGGEGLSGLAKAFFYAGARSILVSHWPLETNAALKLTTSLFERSEEGGYPGRAAALRDAKLAMIQDPAAPHFAHPFFWAPFVLVGEGGP